MSVQHSMRKPPSFLFGREHMPSKYYAMGGAFGKPKVVNQEALDMTYAELLAAAKANVRDLIRRRQQAIEEEVRAVQRRNAARLKSHANNSTIDYYLHGNRRSPPRAWTDAEIDQLVGIIRQQGREMIDINRRNAANYAKRRANESYKALRPPKPRPFFSLPRSGFDRMMNDLELDSVGLTNSEMRARNALVLRRRTKKQTSTTPRKRFFGLF
jgi:hypothetical protein